MSPEIEAALDRAAAAVANADALVIGAGAGMGVDSGLPDFRGNLGFWKAYPPYQALGLGFAQMANPRWFLRDPAFAWGFYGHRLQLYRKTKPHSGFQILRQWGERLPHGYFVYTSNVDGQFQRAGFDPDRLVECHGAIDRLQCMINCGAEIFSADPFEIEINHATMTASSPLPRCPRCDALARPNILMFGDDDFDDSPTRQQTGRFYRWLEGLRGGRLVVVECGAGEAVPTVRNLCGMLSKTSGGPLIRINPAKAEVDHRGIGLPLGAKEAIKRIEGRLATMSHHSLRS